MNKKRLCCFIVINIFVILTMFSSEIKATDIQDVSLSYNEKNQPYISVKMVEEASTMTIQFLNQVALDLETTKLKNPDVIITDQENQRTVDFQINNTVKEVRLFFNPQTVESGEIEIKQNNQVQTLKLVNKEPEKESSVESTTLEQKDSAEESGESSAVPKESEQLTESAVEVIDETEPNTDMPETKDLYKQSQTVQELYEEDIKKEGWQSNEENNYLVKSISDNQRLSYGFANGSDIFLTDLFSTDAAGHKLSYRHNINTGSNRSVRSYYFQEESDYKELDDVKLQFVSKKGESIRGYGEFTVSNKVVVDVWTYHVLVKVTLTADAMGNVKKEVEYKRVDKPIIDLTPLKIGYSELTDTDLNGKDGVDVNYIGNKKGMYIESNPYKVMFHVLDKDGPNQWNAGPGRKFLVWATTPSDFFSKPWGIWTTIHGAENVEGKPSELIKHYDDSAVGFRWNAETLKPKSSRTFSYKINLGEPKPPKLILEDIPSSVLNGEFFPTDISGTVVDEDSSKVALHYWVDEEKEGTPVNVDTASHQIQNVTIKKNELNQYLTSKKLSTGKHTLYFVAQDEEDHSSKVVEKEFTIVKSGDKYIFDATLKNQSSFINAIHVGDKLHYKIFFENLKIANLAGRFINEIPVELQLDKDSVKATVDKQDIGKSLLISTDRIAINDLPLKKNQIFLLEFDVTVKDSGLNKMLVDVINESKFKNETIEVKQKSLGSEGKILDNPKPYISFSTPEEEVIAGESANLNFEIGNQLTNVEDFTKKATTENGEWRQVQFLLPPKSKEINYEKVELLDSKGQLIALMNSSGDVAYSNEEDQQHIQLSYQQADVTKNKEILESPFKENLKPEEKAVYVAIDSIAKGESYQIKVEAKIDKTIKEQIVEFKSFVSGNNEVNDDKSIELGMSYIAIKPAAELKVLVPNDISFEAKADSSILETKGQRLYPAKPFTVQVINTTDNPNWSLAVTGELEPITGGSGNKAIKLSLLDGKPITGTVSSKDHTSTIAFKSKQTDEGNDLVGILTKATRSGAYKGTITWQLNNVITADDPR